jgi:hypothetical protein
MSDERRLEALPIDPRVDAAWRTASQEEPPTSVDNTILAAARDAVRVAPRQRPSVARQPWWQRWQPLAAAAGVVGLALVLVPMLPRDEPPPTSAAPATPAARSADIALPDQTLQKAASSELADSTRGAASADAAATESVTLSAEVWAHQVADLHAAGDVAMAAAELQAFRAAYPDADAHLPQDLRAWAATVPAPTSP